MYDADMELLMKICKASSHANNYIKSLLPVEGATFLTYQRSYIPFETIGEFNRYHVDEVQKSIEMGKR